MLLKLLLSAEACSHCYEQKNSDSAPLFFSRSCIFSATKRPLVLLSFTLFVLSISPLKLKQHRQFPIFGRWYAVLSELGLGLGFGVYTYLSFHLFVFYWFSCFVFSFLFLCSRLLKVTLWWGFSPLCLCRTTSNIVWIVIFLFLIQYFFSSCFLGG